MAKCGECGFLARKHNTNQDYYEAREEFRESLVSRDGSLSGAPYCFREKREFEQRIIKEVAAAIGKPTAGDRNDAYVADLQKDFPCDFFEQWRPDFSPKEHLVMMWDERERQRERDWREDQTNKTEERHGKQMKALEAQHEKQMGLQEKQLAQTHRHHVINLAVFGLAMIAMQCVIAFFQGGAK